MLVKDFIDPVRVVTDEISQPVVELEAFLLAILVLGLREWHKIELLLR